MLIKVLNSKIHAVRVTDANLNYVGSITLDVNFLEQAQIPPWAEVFIVNNNNGARFETYVIPGERGKEDVCLNGAAARLVQKGDEIIIMFFGLQKYVDIVGEDYQPRVFIGDYENGEFKGLTKFEPTVEEMEQIWKGKKNV